MVGFYLLNDGSYQSFPIRGTSTYFDVIKSLCVLLNVIKAVQLSQRLNDIPLADYHNLGTITDAEKYFYFVTRNGMNQMRINTENIASSIVGFYNNQTDSLSTFLLVTMILGIVFIAVPQLFIIPKIFSVNKTNMKVLSLFGYIPPEEVEELAERCEQFILIYLDEITAKREYSYMESK